jgi:branched-chain amino acid transport system substrate-binding protein
LLRLLPAVVIFLVLSALASTASAQGTPVQIGALLPLTGALASYGETSHAALIDAVNEINAKGHRQVELVVEDTETLPETGLMKLKLLHDRGIRVVIGPYASSQVAATKAYADEFGMILLSPLSTARSLAIAGDNVLRFTPDDEQEGKAVAALAIKDGIRAMIPITRADVGNQGLQSAMKIFYEASGGTILPGVTYATNEADFADEVETLATAVHREQTAGRKIGIYLTAFGEVTDLFEAAMAGDPVLRTVKWYGSDSVALSKDLVENQVAAAFAFATIYPNPILGLSDDQHELWGPVSNRLTKVLGRQPDAFALAAYDALNIAYDVVRNVGDDDADRVRRNIEATAADYVGLTGPAVLNNAGDRALGNYDFWSVCPTATGYTWARSATFTASATGGDAREINPC